MVDMRSLIEKYDLNHRPDLINFTREELKNMIIEQLGNSNSDAKERQLEVSIELCRAYCKMMAESFDKASRNSVSPQSVQLQIEVVDKYIDSLNNEIKNLEKINNSRKENKIIWLEIF